MAEPYEYRWNKMSLLLYLARYFGNFPRITVQRAARLVLLYSLTKGRSGSSSTDMSGDLSSRIWPPPSSFSFCFTPNLSKAQAWEAQTAPELLSLSWFNAFELPSLNGDLYLLMYTRAFPLPSHSLQCCNFGCFRHILAPCKSSSVQSLQHDHSR